MKNFPVFSVDLKNCSVKHTENLSTKKFLDFNPNLHVISEVIHWHRARKRTAFAKALSKGQVKGSGKKPFPQKGKGMARQGSLKNPHQRGGGVAFPPMGRSFAYKINRKKIRLALQSIIFTRFMEGRVTIMEDLRLDQPSTPKINKVLELFSLTKILLIDIGNKNLELSSRNVRQVKFLSYANINTFDFTYYPHIILTKKVFQTILFSFFS
jgi:large subunit ribosomal protein L4